MSARRSVEAMTRAAVLAWEEAVHSLGIEPTQRIRPNPAQWLWYAVWGPLPERHRMWVLYDATTSTWVLRHFLRILTTIALPVAAIAIFLPAPGGLRALTAFVTGACAFFLTAVWVNEGTEHRLIQAGWRWGLGPEVRERRSQMAQRIGAMARRDRMRARRS
jgi:hypothetical protein